MRQLKTILAPLLIACLVALLAAVPAFAISPPPSIFHGTIKVNGANVPDGLLILALINGEYCAFGYTGSDQGNPTYSLEVPGDDPGTPEREGGREGDTVQFELGGVLADQAGTWHSGMSVQLDLTLLADGVPPTLMPTISPDSVPTQTSGPAVQPSPTVSPTPQPTLQLMPAPTLTPTALRQPSPTPTRTPTPSVPPSPTSTALATPTWTLTPTRQPSRASLPSPAPTQTIVPTGPPSPTMTSSPSPRGTPVLSAQSPPAITPSATAVQTIELAGQPPVTSVSLPTAARTAIPPAQPGPKPIVRLSSETNDSGARLEGIWLMAAALVIALVTCLVIAVGVVIGYIRQPR